MNIHDTTKMKFVENPSRARQLKRALNVYLNKEHPDQAAYPSLVTFPVSILHKSIAARYRPVRVADGPITARYRFIKNASWVVITASTSKKQKQITEFGII